MNRFFQSMIAKFTQSRKPRSSRREGGIRRTRPAVEALEDRLVPTVTIQFDYSLDSSGWFSDATPLGATTLGQTRRDALQRAANDLTGRLNDTLAAIPSPSGTNRWTADFDHPGMGNRVSLANLQIPADSLIIFVGSRDLSGNLAGQATTGFSSSGDAAWNDLILGRGEPGAVGPAASRTDVGPWGGAIAFDGPTNWYFGQVGTVPAGQLDFYSVAQHEIGHLLGFDEDNPSWNRLVSGSNFTGPESRRAYGGATTPEDVPVEPVNQGHWLNGVTSPKVGGVPTSMDPSTDAGRRTAFTPLDFAALDDIGWELTQPPQQPPPVPPTIPVIVSITELVQFESPDDGIDDDGDYYIRVTINGVQQSDTNEKSPEGDDQPFDPGWSFSQPVPTNLSSVPVNIQIYDSDGVFNFEDNEMDISPVPGHLSIDFSVSLTNGRWVGGPSFPFFYPTNESQGNGEGDGRIKIKFNIAVPSAVARALVVDAGGGLTVQGDQFAPNLNDDVTFDRTASGGLKVTINGHVVEYAPGAITSVVVNTGSGSNTITMLSTFPGIPVTINGGGTDRLKFGPGLPVPVFTPDANGLPGFGTLNVGGATIHLRGLEFVDGVAPDVTGVQLTSVTIDENGVATVTGTFSDPGSYATHSLAINWGDGTSDPLSRLVLGNRSFAATHRYLDDNPSGSPGDTYTITVTVRDNDNLSDTATTTVRVNNVAPQLRNVAVTPEINENGVVTLSGDILDPGTQDTFTLLVDWGEGSPQSFSYPAGTTHFSVTHQYPDDNPTGTPQDLYTIRLTLTDDDTGQATAAGSTLVKNVAPVLTSLGTSSTSAGPAREGEPFTISGAFTDVGTLDTHAVSVDWGDGTVTTALVTEAGGAGSFVAQHAYQFGGIYPVLVTLRDDDTGEVSRVKTVFVTGVGVHVVGGLTSLQVVGTIGADDVTIYKQGNGQITVLADFLDEGQRTLPLAGLDIIQVVLLAGDDWAVIASNVGLPAVLDGGDGNDYLKGSNAGSVLIGGRGDDYLIGGNGRDILIGGPGADRLVGGGGGDILIGGFTAYDSGPDDDKLANDLALLRLREEWGSGRPFAERVANLRGGVGPVLGGTGLRLHKGTTVFDDLDADVLTGSADLDWFFFALLMDSLNGDHDGDEKN